MKERNVVSLDADLIECLTDVSAKPGDMLLVFAGRCLGVYRGVTTATKAADKAAPAKERASRTWSPADVTAALQCGPMSALQIGDHYNLPRSDRHPRARLGTAIRQARDAKMIVAVEDGRKVQRTWRLAD